MADKEIKIKVVVDDSQEKKYYQESDARRKKSTVQENEEEKRKTASLKTELAERYARLRSALNLELEAVKQGNRLEIKEAIAKRKVMESELRTFEAFNRNSLSNQLADFKAEKQKEVALFKSQIREIQNAPRTTLRGNIGSEAYVRQLQSARTTMLPTSPEYGQTTALINRYKDVLKQSGVEVKSLAQNIRGELTSALTNQAGVLIGTVGAWKLFNLSLESAKFEVLRANFQGTNQDLEMFRKATAGTVDDASLIKLSNQASDLGIDLKNQAILFSLAEDAADKYGTTIEEGFQKVVFATEGNIKGLKFSGIQKAEYEAIVKRLALAHGDEIDKLDADTQKQIRLQAILEASGRTYDDVNNKVQDSADKHEQFIVIVKNLALYYGGDLFNAVTGVGTAYKMLNQLLDDSNRLITAGVGVANNLVNAWQNVTAQIPVVGDAIGWLADRYRDLFGAQSQTAGKIFTDAGADFPDSFDPNQVPDIVRKGMGFNSSKKTGLKGSGSTKTETQKEVLNLIELEQQKLAKLNTQLQANLGDIGSELQLRREILDVELKIFELRTGQKINLGATLEGRNSLNIGTAGVIQRYIGINSRAGNNPEQDFTSDMLKPIELTFDNIKSVADDMLGSFQQMLQFSGLMETDFGKIIQMIQMLFNTGSSISSIISTVLSFIPGGSVIGGIGGGGGMMKGFDPLGGGMPHGGNLNVIVNSEVEKTKSVKFYQGTLPEYERRLAYKSI